MERVRGGWIKILTHMKKLVTKKKKTLLDKERKRKSEKASGRKRASDRKNDKLL